MITFSTIRILFFCCLGHFAVDFMVGIWPVYKTIARVDLLIAGIIAGSSAFLSEGFQFLFGHLADRGFQRILLAISLILASLSTLFPCVESTWSFYFLYLGTCLGSASFHPTASSLLGGLPLTNKHAIMGLFSAFGMCGLGISHMLFSWANITFQGGTYLLAIPVIILSFLALLSIRGEITTRQNEHSFSLKPIIRCFQNTTLRALFIALVGNQMVFWSLVFLLPDFLLSRGFDPWIVFGGGHLSLMAGAALAPPLFGYIADKTSTKLVLGTISAAALAIFYFLLIPQETTPVALLIHLFLLGAFLASFSPIVWSIGNQLEPNNRGTVSAFLMGFVWMISESIGVGASGVLAGFFETDGPVKSLACMGLASLITLFYVFMVPKSSVATTITTEPSEINEKI